MKPRPDFQQTMIPDLGQPAPSEEKIDAFLNGAPEAFEVKKKSRRGRPRKSEELVSKIKVAKYFQIDEKIVKDMATFAYKELMENNKKISDTDIVETALRRYLKGQLKENINI